MCHRRAVAHTLCLRRRCRGQRLDVASYRRLDATDRFKSGLYLDERRCTRWRQQ